MRSVPESNKSNSQLSEINKSSYHNNSSAILQGLQKMAESKKDQQNQRTASNDEPGGLGKTIGILTTDVASKGDQEHAET